MLSRIAPQSHTIILYGKLFPTNIISKHHFDFMVSNIVIKQKKTDFTEIFPYEIVATLLREPINLTKDIPFG